MITKRTVLILGAGAGKVYKFPTGRELLFDVVAILVGGGSVREIVRQYGNFSISDTVALGEALKNSSASSVDEFLENRPEFMPIGKATIAAALIPHESSVRLDRREDRETWYEYLFQQMGSDKDSFKENQLAILTFNFDRSIEYFLLRAIQYMYGLNLTDGIEYLNSIPIVHMYGQLGKPNFLDSDGRDYTDKVTEEAIDICVNEITLVSEASNTADSPEFERAYELIARAERLCFLGFGYHEVNIKRLRVNELFKGFRIWGTAYDLRDAERARKEALLVRANTTLGPQLGFERETCLDFLRTYRVF